MYPQKSGVIWKMLLNTHSCLSAFKSIHALGRLSLTSKAEPCTPWRKSFRIQPWGLLFWTRGCWLNYLETLWLRWAPALHCTYNPQWCSQNSTMSTPLLATLIPSYHWRKLTSWENSSWTTCTFALCANISFSFRCGTKCRWVQKSQRRAYRRETSVVKTSSEPRCIESSCIFLSEMSLLS